MIPSKQYFQSNTFKAIPSKRCHRSKSSLLLTLPAIHPLTPLPSDSKKPPTILSLTISSLTPSTKVFGYVKTHISPSLTLISLQNMLTGYVLRKDNEPPLSSTLPLGTFQQFSIVSIDKVQKRIQLSPSTTLINRGITSDQLCVGFVLKGTVKSEEDHGHIIDCKIQGTSSFLPSKFNSKTLSINGDYNFKIKSYNEKSKQITLTTEIENETSVIPNHVSPTASAHTIKSLLPGQKVKVR